MLPSDEDLIEKLIAMLDAAKLDCKPSVTDQDTGVCEADKAHVPPTNFTYSEPALFLVSHLRRKDEPACEQLLPKINEVNGSVERVKVICLENRLTLTSMLVVPENGLTGRDVQQCVTAFRQAAQGIQRVDGIAEALKP